LEGRFWKIGFEEQVLEGRLKDVSERQVLEGQIEGRF
jgi:hypothetical protein